MRSGQKLGKGFEPVLEAESNGPVSSRIAGAGFGHASGLWAWRKRRGVSRVRGWLRSPWRRGARGGLAGEGLAVAVDAGENVGMCLVDSDRRLVEMVAVGSASHADSE